MAAMNIPIEIYDLLERRLGRDDAMAVAKSIEASLSHIEERSREIAVQRKLEAKEELRVELRNELTTKEDLANAKSELRAEIAELRTELKAEIAEVRTELARLDKKFTVLWLTTIFAVIFVNQNALEFLARILGLIK